MTIPVNTRDAILQASVDRIENDAIDDAIALVMADTNKIFAQRAEPYSDSFYTLRKDDIWIDRGSINYATYTSEMSSGTNEYNLYNMSTTLLNQVAGPLPYITGNSLVADRFIEDNTTSGKYIYKPIKWATIGTGTHTISIYLKANTSYTVRFAELIVLSVVTGINKYASFDLTNGFCKTSDDSTITAVCYSVGNGWYRCSMTVTITNPSNSSLQIRLSDINSSFAHAYTGNGNSGMYAWGLMVEANVDSNVAPGKYIENSTGTVPGIQNTISNNVIYTWDTLYWATAQLKELSDITSDDILTPAEKSYVIREYDSILNEQTQLNDQATTLGGLTSSTTTYNTAVTTLTNYLATLSTPYMWNDIAAGHTTDINGSTFRTNFTTFYTARDVYKKDITVRSSELAVWDTVSGVNKPADYASNGTILNTDPFCTKLSKWSGNGIGYYTENTGLTDGQMGVTSFRYHNPGASNKYISSNLVPVDPDKIYRFRGWFRKSAGSDGVLYLIAGLADSNGTIISGSGTHWKYPASAVSLTTSWVEYSGVYGYGQTITIPSNAKYIYIGTYMHYNGTTGYHECQGLRLEDISISAWQNVVGTSRPEDNANNIGVSSETPPAGALSLTSSLDASTGTYLLRPIKSKNKGIDLAIGSDLKTIEVESHSSERDHILLSSDFSTSSTSLANVTGMKFSVDTNTIYYITGTLLVYTTSVGTTFTADITGPSGATIYMYPNSGSALVGQTYPYPVTAIISTGGTAGLVKLRFASGSTNTVVLKENTLLVLNEVVNSTPPISGGYVLDTTPGFSASDYISSQDTTSGGATASLIITAKPNGTVVISVGAGDSLSGTPTSDNWSTGAGNDPQNFEVLFSTSSSSGSPTVSNGAASYTKLDADRVITITKSCAYGAYATANIDVTVTIRKRGTTTPTYSDTIGVTINVSSENPFV